MTDRELLELAAKAAGAKTKWINIFGKEVLRADFGEGFEPWNPQDDDGDALRLAVELDMNVFQATKSAYAMPSDDDGTYERQVRYADANGDKKAATRRAIVRAAAEIGKGMV